MATVSRSVPPRSALITRIPAYTGPSTTVDHSSALKSAFLVMRGPLRSAGDVLLSISPGVFDRLAVSGVVSTEGEKLQAVRAGPERPPRRGRNAGGVQRTD